MEREEFGDPAKDDLYREEDNGSHDSGTVPVEKAAMLEAQRCHCRFVSISRFEGMRDLLV